MRDTRLQAPPLQIMLTFLTVPSGGATPFGNESFAVGFDGGEGFIVGGFEEVGDAED